MIDYSILPECYVPEDLNELTKKTKKITSKNDAVFKKLFKELKKHEVKNMDILAEWIKYLKDNPYNVNFDELNFRYVLKMTMKIKTHY